MKSLLVAVVMSVLMLPLLSGEFNVEMAQKEYGGQDIVEPMAILNKVKKYLLRPVDVQDVDLLKSYCRDITQAIYLLQPVVEGYKTGAESNSSLKEASKIERISTHYEKILINLEQLILVCYYNLGLKYRDTKPLTAYFYFKEVFEKSVFNEEKGLRLKAEQEIKVILDLEKLESYSG